MDFSSCFINDKNSKNGFFLSEWHLKRFSLNDLAEVQDFLNLFQDFFMMCEARKGSAKTILIEGPDHKNPEQHKQTLGIYQNQKLMGLIDWVQNYPEKRTWTLGYFLIHPQWQRQNHGTTFIQNLSAALKKNSVENLRCVVQSQNPKALKFWQLNGFMVTKIIKNKNKPLEKTFILTKAL